MSGGSAIQIRPAKPEDMPALLALSQEWAAEGITYGYSPTGREAFAGYRCWVAEADGEVVGYAGGEVDTARRNIEIQQAGERYFELEELYVCPAWGRGVGQLLLARVEEDARREGLAQLMLNAANRDHAPLLRFYLREGMTPHSFRMFKKL